MNDELQMSEELEEPSASDAVASPEASSDEGAPEAHIEASEAEAEESAPPAAEQSAEFAEIEDAPNSVVSLKSLLAPIPGDDPSGENLRYSGLYDEISEARRADDTMNQGEWQTDLKVADYRRVIDLAVPALTSQSKDLQICAWLSESLVRQYGFAGLRDSLKLTAALQERFWETLHPEIDEGDMEGRGNAIAWMDAQTALAIMGVPFTGGGGYSYLDWETSKKYDFPDNLDQLDTSEQIRINELKAQAEKERAVTTEMWKRAIAATRRAEVETVNLAVEECWAELKNLNRVIEEKFDRKQMPGLGNLNKTLDTVHSQIKRLLDEKRLEEPDEADAAEEGEIGADGTPVAAGGVATATGAINSRQDALKRLADVANYFQRSEPHSPVSYLVQRAVIWGNMPLETWLQDVIKDENVLYQLRQTLGFNTRIGEPEV